MALGERTPSDRTRPRLVTHPVGVSRTRSVPRSPNPREFHSLFHPRMVFALANVRTWERHSEFPYFTDALKRARSALRPRVYPFPPKEVGNGNDTPGSSGPVPGTPRERVGTSGTPLAIPTLPRPGKKSGPHLSGFFREGLSNPAPSRSRILQPSFGATLLHPEPPFSKIPVGFLGERNNRTPSPPLRSLFGEITTESRGQEVSP